MSVTSHPHAVLQRWISSLETPAFQQIQQTDYIDIPLFSDSYLRASQGIMGRLLQALYREELLPLSGPINEEYDCVIDLPKTGGKLVIEKVLRLPTSALFLNGAICVNADDEDPAACQILYEPSQLLTLLHENGLLNIDDEPALKRLCQECDDSFDNDVLSTLYHHHYSRQMHQRYGDNWLKYFTSHTDTADNWVLELEEWGTIGHPWHPNYKTKLGLSTAQVIAWSPEFRARLPITIIAVAADSMQITELADAQDFRTWCAQGFADLHDAWQKALQVQNLDPEQYLPLPVHPWQMVHFLTDNFQDAIADKRVIIDNMPELTVAPTMSFRTVIPAEHSKQQPLIKLPVSLRLTSVERTVSPKSSVMGPRVSSFLQQILSQDKTLSQALKIVPERYGMFWKDSPVEADLARHLSVLYRDNPNSMLQQGQLAIPVGALFHTDHRELPLMAQWMELKGIDLDSDNAIADKESFYEDYCRGVIRPTLGAYLKYGIAFEAHQQNSYAIIDNKGQFQHLLLRDFGDIRIHRDIFAAHGFSTEQYDPRHTFFDENDRRFVREKYIHAVLMCHISEVTLMMNRYFGMPVDKVWSVFARVVAEEFEFWKSQSDPQHWATERKAILEEDWPAKALLRMRLQDESEDIVGSTANPLVSYTQPED